MATITPGLKWDNINLSVTIGRGKKAVKKELLHGVSGYAHRGEMTAIMGPSGSGKTTLSNILTGRLGSGNYELSGKVTFEGKPRNASTWKSTTAYVEQEDLMYACLTVEETIIFSAMMRLPSKQYTKAQKIERAKKIIDILGLSKVRDTYVGTSQQRGVSGGERKRTAVGVELVTSPKLMFLDEPTSGLDSHSAFNVISTVKEVASQGVAVLVTIHQPAYELFRMFDKIILIAAGRIAFHGTIQEAVDHFARIGYPVPEGANAADHFISMLTDPASATDERLKNRVNEILNAWETKKNEAFGSSTEIGSVNSKEVGGTTNNSLVNTMNDDDSGQTGFALSPVEEIWWLFRRGLMQTLRDKRLIIAAFSSNTFVGLILAFTFFRLGGSQSDVIGKGGLLFFIPVNISFGVLFPIISVLPLLNGILTRERSTGAYRVSSFYLARYFLEAPLAIITRIPFFLMVYWICGFKPQAGPFFTYLGINFLTTIYAVSMGFFIGSTSRSMAVVQSVTPGVNVLFLLFGGFLLPLNAIPPWFVWIHWISFLTYSFAGLAIT